MLSRGSRTSEPALLPSFRNASNSPLTVVFGPSAHSFFVNAGWMRDGQLLEKQGIDKIRAIPTVSSSAASLSFLAFRPSLDLSVAQTQPETQADFFFSSHRRSLLKVDTTYVHFSLLPLPPSLSSFLPPAHFPPLLVSFSS